MIKVMVLLRRRPDSSAPDFRRHLEETHLPLVARLPGLQRLVANHVQASAGGGVQPYDAIVEDWFSTPDAMQGAFTGPEGQAVSRDVPSFIDPDQLRVLVVEEAEVPLPARAGGALDVR